MGVLACGPDGFTGTMVYFDLVFPYFFVVF